MTGAPANRGKGQWKREAGEPFQSPHPCLPYHGEDTGWVLACSQEWRGKGQCSGPVSQLASSKETRDTPNFML